MPDKEEKKESSEQAGKPEDEEEEETCGFCIFMKAGGCKKEFQDWSKCVDKEREEERNFAEECKDATINLQKCMVAHKDYYKDFLGEEEQAGGDADKKEEGLEKKGAEHKPDSRDGGKESAGSTSDKREGAQQSGDESAGGSKGEDKDDQGSTGADKDDKGSKGGDEGDKGGKGGSIVGNQAEKLEKAQQDSPAKQQRVVNQETHPLKAKPDTEKKETAKQQPPEPEREDSNQADAAREEQGGDEDADEEEEQKPHIEVKTVPYDRRFVTTNQARHCYTRYNEYYKCVAEKGEDNEDCSFFQRAYRSICPGDWVDKWNEQREEGTWAGRY